MGYVNEKVWQTVYLLATGDGAFKERAHSSYQKAFSTIGAGQEKIPEQFSGTINDIHDALGNRAATHEEVRHAVELLIILYHDLGEIPDTGG